MMLLYSKTLIAVALLVAQSVVVAAQWQYGYQPTCDACGNDDYSYNKHDSGGNSKGKLTSLTLTYLGTNQGGSNNEQGPLGDKWGYTGNVLPPRAVIRVFGKSNNNMGTFTVGFNEQFTVTASKFDSYTYFSFENTGSQVFIHTSCSQILKFGDQFGSLRVSGFTNTNGGNSAQCQPLKDCYENHEQCPQCVMCPANDKDFKPSVVSFAFVGGPAILSNPNQDKASISGSTITGNHATVVCNQVGFQQSLSVGQVGTIQNVQSGGNDLICHVSGSNGGYQSISIHVSCSDPLVVGDRFGALELSGFVLQNKKNYAQTISSSDPHVCPVCKRCCKMADLHAPHSITLPCDGPFQNNQRLQEWVSSAKCYEKDTNRPIKVTNSHAMLNGAETCALSATVTWTCVDDCGNTHHETATFSIVDNVPPQIVVPPKNEVAECNVNEPGAIPQGPFQQWLSIHGGMVAYDDCQSSDPCPTHTGSGTYGAPVGTTGFNSYYQSSTSILNSNSIHGQNYYSVFRSAELNAKSTSAYANNCGYCSTQAQKPCCANGVQYDNPCQAHCNNVYVYANGPCSSGYTTTNTNYITPFQNNVGVTSYLAGFCNCVGGYDPVCSIANGRDFFNSCQAQCSGVFNFVKGACSDYQSVVPYTGGTTTSQCTHCTGIHQACCGANGVEYTSPCHAACHGVTNWHYGACTIYAPTTFCGKDIQYSYSAPVMSGYLPHDSTLTRAVVEFKASDTCGNVVRNTATFQVIDTTPPNIQCLGKQLTYRADSSCAAFASFEQDAMEFLQLWVNKHGCLCAVDCSAVSWTATNVPVAPLVGKVGYVTFTASDAFGNAMSKNLKYDFSAISSEPCKVCGHEMYGQKVKASIQQLTFKFEGTSAQTLFVDEVFPEQQLVHPGATFSISVSGASYKKRDSNGGSSNKLPTNTVFHIGAYSATLHTSCSQPIATGQVINVGPYRLVLVGFRTDVSSSNMCQHSQQHCAYPVICNHAPKPYPTLAPTTMAPTPCEPTPTSVCPPYEDKKKYPVQGVTLRVVPGPAMVTNQQEGKAYVVSGSLGVGPFTVVCTNGVSQGVPLFGEYIWSSSKFKSSSTCTISSINGMSQVVEIHMSCSKALNVGDQFGNLLLTGFRRADVSVAGLGNNCGPYNPPTAPYNPPTYLYYAPTFPYNPPATAYNPPATVYNPPATVYNPPATVYNPSPPCPPAEVIEACGANDKGKSGSSSSKPKLQSLTLQLVSLPGLTQNQGGKGGYSGAIGSQGPYTVSCDGGTTQTLNIGGLYAWNPNAFDSASTCLISSPGGTQVIDIHTSCSQLLVSGDQFGNLVVVGFALTTGFTVTPPNCPTAPPTYTYMPPTIPYTPPTSEYTPPSVPYTPPTSVYTPPTVPFTPPTSVYTPPTVPYTPPTSVYTPPTAPPAARTVLQTLAHESDLEQFSRFLTEYSIAPALAGEGPYTIFAVMDSENVASNFPNLDDQAKTTAQLLYHIVPGRYMPADLTDQLHLNTYNGVVTVVHKPNGVALMDTQGNFKYIIFDAAASNGHVYKIHGALQSSLLYTPPTTPPTYTVPPSLPPSTVVAPPTAQAAQCAQPQACVSNGRLTRLTFQYGAQSGSGYAQAVDHQQLAWGKGFVQHVALDNGALPAEVLVVVQGKDDGVTVDGWRFSLALGDTFTLLGTNNNGFLKAINTIKLNGKSVRLNTNCAAPIGLGDRFGALTVVGYENSYGESCISPQQRVAEASAQDGAASTDGSVSGGFSGTEIGAVVLGCAAAVVLVVGALVVRKTRVPTEQWAQGSTSEVSQ